MCLGIDEITALFKVVRNIFLGFKDLIIRLYSRNISSAFGEKTKIVRLKW